jgi:hypothetical protein
VLRYMPGFAHAQVEGKRNAKQQNTAILQETLRTLIQLV